MEYVLYVLNGIILIMDSPVTIFGITFSLWILFIISIIGATVIGLIISSIFK